MEQRCHLAMVWLTWLTVPLLATLAGLAVGVRTDSAVLGVVVGLVVLAAGIIGQVLYVRWFPHISRSMGYDSVADTAAVTAPASGIVPSVTLYTASVCPFCAIIRRRLAALQERSSFEVRRIDVTFRPEIIRAKGLRSVPVLEANGRVLVGNATSAQIAEFLKSAVNADGRSNIALQPTAAGTDAPRPRVMHGR